VGLRTYRSPGEIPVSTIAQKTLTNQVDRTAKILVKTTDIMDNDVLRRFFMAAQDLREAMESGMSLDDIDRLCLENYISLLHISYSEWRRQSHRAHRMNSRFADSDGAIRDNPLSPQSN
jgi:hypothetical protein